MVLERYDDKVIEAVTSPTGIQRTCKFPPSLAEVVEFIDEHIRRTNYAAEYNSRSEQQLRERNEGGTTESPEHRRKVAERIKAELRGRGFEPPSC